MPHQDHKGDGSVQGHHVKKYGTFTKEEKQVILEFVRDF